jgi:hypothetical protein
MRAHVDLPRRMLSALAVFTLAVLLAAGQASAQPAGTTTVGGQVVHGVEEAGVAGVEVALLVSEEGEVNELATTITGEDGRFLFARAPVDVELEVTAVYQQATSRSGPFVATSEGTPDLELVVYEVTDDPTDVRITSWVVWVDRSAGVAFQHDLRVENLGDRTWMGFGPEADGHRTVLSVPLHPGASGIGFLGRFTECCATMRGAEYVHSSPLLPGRTLATVRYAVETTDRLDLTTRLPVDSFVLMLPDGVSATGPALERTGEIESRGNVYGVYTTEGWEQDEELTIRLHGLDAAPTPWWWFAAAGAGGLLAAASVVWWWRRSSSAEGAAASVPAAPDAPADAGALTADVLLEELALLDLARERGFISDEVHQILRAARTSELHALHAGALGRATALPLGAEGGATAPMAAHRPQA